MSVVYTFAVYVLSFVVESMPDGRNAVCHPFNGWAVWLVADFGTLSCQVTRKFIRYRNAEIHTISAIKYTACYSAYFIHCQTTLSD
ncbi:MAG: hypothetical protein PHE45_08585 [Bacteroidales bacterium]|jgi:hypothetical protein|nr:hypothetical protein [Bacteroidales bacterium]MDD3152926.1 hypothetical protein [Bacteroidales bacterium]